MLSNTIKQKRKEKAGKWEVPLPKVSVPHHQAGAMCAAYIMLPHASLFLSRFLVFSVFLSFCLLLSLDVFVTVLQNSTVCLCLSHQVRPIAEDEAFKVLKSGKRGKKSWKRMITKVTYVGPGFTRKPPKYERFIRPTGACS